MNDKIRLFSPSRSTATTLLYYHKDGGTPSIPKRIIWEALISSLIDRIGPLSEIFLNSTGPDRGQTVRKYNNLQTIISVRYQNDINNQTAGRLIIVKIADAKTRLVTNL